LKTIISILYLIFYPLRNFAADVCIKQAGYLNNLPKLFYHQESADSFYIIVQASETNYYRGALVFSVTNDSIIVLSLCKGDISTLAKTI